MSMLQNLLLLTASLAYLSPCVAVDFYVTPTHPSNQTCLSQPNPCYTLDQYTQNRSLFEGHTNISLIFLDGTHTLTEDLEIGEIETLEISGAGQLLDQDEMNVSIKLQGGLLINNVAELHIHRIIFNGTDSIDTQLSTIENKVQLYNVQSTKVYQVMFVSANTLIVNNGSYFHKVIDIMESVYFHSPLSFEYLDNATFNLQDTDIIGSGLLFGCHLLRCNPSALITLSVQGVHMKGESLLEGILISTIPTLTLKVVDTDITGYNRGLTILHHNETLERKQTIVIVTSCNITRNINGIYLTDLAMLQVEVEKANIVENVYGMIISDSNDIIIGIKDTNIENNTHGLLLINTENIASVIQSSNVRRNRNGMSITHSSKLNTTMTDCDIVGKGIWIY